MGKLRCCDKIGVRRGPWTPEEDILLVSYIQKHGPKNWTAIPFMAGLDRCCKSCRLRWNNYLRPGIKRGNFSRDEEKIIIRLQALLGNRWAAIALYLPQRTDIDIKNYWNSRLKKKLKTVAEGDSCSPSTSRAKGQWERSLQTDILQAKRALCDALSLDRPARLSPENVLPAVSQPPSSSFYPSSAENIAKLLKNWMTTTQKRDDNVSKSSSNGGEKVADQMVGYNSTISLRSHHKDELNTSASLTNNQMTLSFIEKLLFDDNGSQLQENISS